MQLKTTRAFRTISEAGEELELQPHVLRFWESKFPQIKPMKRGGGRRFYRPEDIEFLRGIKILLHDEKHPIKDVQKLIRVKGANRVLELGRSVERAAKPKAVKDVDLIPERIANFEPPLETKPDDEILRPISAPPAAPSVTTAKAANSQGAKIVPVIHPVRAQDNHAIPAVRETLQPVDTAEYSNYSEAELGIDEVQGDDVTLAAAPPYAVQPQVDVEALEDALARLNTLRGRWDKFKANEAT